jgi:hypothetical protein
MPTSPTVRFGTERYGRFIWGSPEGAPPPVAPILLTGYIVDWIKPDGVVVRINDNALTFLPYGWADGIEAPDVDMPVLRQPGLDGSVRMGRPYTPPRAFGVKWDALYDDHNALTTYLATIGRHLSPYWSEVASGYVRITAPDGRVRQIDALPGARDATLVGPSVAHVLQRFKSAAGFWYDPTQAVLTVALSSPGGVAVPFVFDAATGLPFAASDVDSHVAATNAGDAPTWPVVRVYGPGDDPIVENETMATTMDLTGVSLAAGDYVDIDMAARTIYKYTASCRADRRRPTSSG